MLQINKEDGGTRQFIAVTNNENKICEEVTYPRLEKVIKGYKNKSGNKVEGLGGNLNYFQTSLLKKSPNSDEMKIRIAENCVDLLCFKEGIFEEVTKNESFSIFKCNEKVLAIYHSYDDTDLNAMKNELDNLKLGNKKAYIFTFDNSGLNPSDYEEWANIDIEPIPQNILEVLGGYDA